MASDGSINLIVGSLVSFTSTTGIHEFFQGTVYFFDAEDACFGIDDVSRTSVRGSYHPVEGCYQFFLKEVEDLRVIRVPSPKPTTNTTKDDQKSNPGGASTSSSSTPPAQ